MNNPRIALGHWIWIMATALLAAAVMVLALYGCGCASSKPTENYPFPIMLDPVTEVTPHVKVK